VLIQAGKNPLYKENQPMKTLLLFVALAIASAVIPAKAHGPMLPPDPWAGQVQQH
jgi:hypothetical protein